MYAPRDVNSLIRAEGDEDSHDFNIGGQHPTDPLWQSDEWKASYTHPLQDVLGWLGHSKAEAFRLACQIVALPDFCQYKRRYLYFEDDVETSRGRFFTARDLEICDPRGATPLTRCFFWGYDHATHTGQSAFNVLADFWTRFPATVVQQLGYTDPIRLMSCLGWAIFFECVDAVRYMCDTGMMTDALLAETQNTQLDLEASESTSISIRDWLSNSDLEASFPGRRFHEMRTIILEWEALPESERRQRSRRFYAPVLDPVLVHTPRHALNLMYRLCATGRAIPLYTTVGWQNVVSRLFILDADGDAAVFRSVVRFLF